VTKLARGDAPQGSLTVDWRTVGAFRENAYLVVDRESGTAALVDPGGDPDALVEMVRDSGAELQAIWLTHAHLDHVGGIAGVKRVWDVPVYLHADDLPLYRGAADVARGYGLPFEQPEDPDRRLAAGDRLTLGATSFAVHHTPGHAPGHVVLVGPALMLGGDLVFAGSIGRTDLPYCDPVAMQRSLSHVLQFDDATVVYPGHGPATTIGAERATNPFLAGLVAAEAR
jgi:glyoxylase-like metal-dependent hydrolase (beta-lactamase superfamily II)